MSYKNDKAIRLARDNGSCLGRSREFNALHGRYSSRQGSVMTTDHCCGASVNIVVAQPIPRNSQTPFPDFSFESQ